MNVEVIPIYEDNYVFGLVDQENLVLVDPGASEPVLRFVESHQLNLIGILITHHHWDHVDGVQGILKKQNCPVWGPSKDVDRLPFKIQPIHEGQTLKIGNFIFEIWELPGHTMHHLAYVEKNKKWVFSGDVLFGYGCGRLFEGSFEQAFSSLQKFKTLPPETLVYCAHEYTMTNLKFVQSLEKKDQPPGLDKAVELETNKLNTLGRTIPLDLHQQIQFNPFLRVNNVQDFKRLRTLRNLF